MSDLFRKALEDISAEWNGACMGAPNECNLLAENMVKIARNALRAAAVGADVRAESIENAIRRAIQIYADSYRSMSQMDDAKVRAGTVAYDLEHNVINSTIEAVRHVSAVVGADENTAEKSA